MLVQLNEDIVYLELKIRIKFLMRVYRFQKYIIQFISNDDDWYNALKLCA